MEKEIEEIVLLMDEVIEDRSIPRNIRKAVTDAKEFIELKDPEKLTNAIYLLDDISNDVNMPSHARTDIWDIISRLEALREKTK